MRDTAVIRLLGDSLVWYPPGSGEPPRSLDDGAAIEQLEALLQRNRNAVIFAVPGAEVRLQELAITAEEKRHVGKSLPFMLEDEFASDIEGLHFASCFRDKLQLAVAACDEELMLRWEEMLQPLPPISLWVPETLLLPWEYGEVCVLIEAEQVLVRHAGNAGFVIERDAAAAWLASLDSDPVDSVVVYGADQSEDMKLIPETLRERVQWRTGDFAAALMLSGEVSEPLNLRQGRFGPSLPLDRWWRQWRLAAVMMLAAFAVHLGASLVEYNSLAAENEQMRVQMEAAYRSVVPRGAMADPEKQLRRKLNGLKGGGQNVGFMPLMEQIGRVVHGQKATQISSVNFTDKVGDIRLVMMAPDFKAVESVRSALAEAGMEADLENSNVQGDSVRARLKIREK